MAKPISSIVVDANTLSANTAGTEEGRSWPGGLLELAAQGTFDSGTLKVQFSLTADGGGTWTDLPGVSLTANGVTLFADPLGQANYVRVQLSGATSPSITYNLTRVVAGPQVP